MGRQMTEFGGSTFAWFTRNPRGGKAKDIEPADVEKLQAILTKEKFGNYEKYLSVFGYQ